MYIIYNIKPQRLYILILFFGLSIVVYKKEILDKTYKKLQQYFFIYFFNVFN